MSRRSCAWQDGLRIKPKEFRWFSPKAVPTDLPVVLSIDPGQKGGPTNAFSVVQAWAVQPGGYLLLKQWREQAPYRDFRHEVRRFIRRYRPGTVLIEATNQGPALSSEIRPRPGREIVLVTPTEDKASRLQKHRGIIRAGMVALPEGAIWVSDFLAELTLFPYAPFDDQADAMSQFLDWASQHPNPPKPPARALVCRVDSNGFSHSNAHNLAPASQCPGCVVGRRLRFRQW